MLYRIKEAVLRRLRVRIFEGYTGNKAEGLGIIGPVYLRNPNVHVGKNVTLYPGVMFQGLGDIYIGDNTFLGNGSIVYAEEGHKVEIGKNCMIAPMVYITTTDHNIAPSDSPMRNNGVISSDTVIEDNVWLASYVAVLKGSHIQSGAVVGAKALVNGYIEKDTVVVGIPARVLKKRENSIK